jgi:hypothetical protein
MTSVTHQPNEYITLCLLGPAVLYSCYRPDGGRLLDLLDRAQPL